MRTTSSSSEVNSEATSPPSKPPNSASRTRVSRSAVPSAARASTSVASPPRFKAFVGDGVEVWWRRAEEMVLYVCSKSGSRPGLVV
ncbi:hypothetical protein QYF36_019626 [Acer negundo]|nr:hypothetical protein QYF36_019626 [Acer negundo]